MSYSGAPCATKIWLPQGSVGVPPAPERVVHRRARDAHDTLLNYGFSDLSARISTVHDSAFGVLDSARNVIDWRASR